MESNSLTPIHWIAVQIKREINKFLANPVSDSCSEEMVNLLDTVYKLADDIQFSARR